MELNLVDPVQTALQELGSEVTTKKSIFLNYYAHCLEVSRGVASDDEKQQLPQLNHLIVSTWNIQTLKKMKVSAWKVIKGEMELSDVRFQS